MAEFDEAVAAFKTNVMAAVNRELATLRERTGVGPSDVRLRLVDVTTQIDTIRQAAVTWIEVDFNL